VEKKKVNSRNRELTRKERRHRTEDTNMRNEEMRSEERERGRNGEKKKKKKDC
jgi:hypothetical protein